MRHLVTGGAGFVGSALVRRLLADGQDVTVLDRFSRGKSERIPDGCKIVVADICDYDSVSDALVGVDRIWHLAYLQGTQTFYSNPKEVIRVALVGMMNLMEAVETAETAPEFVLVSSSEAYQIPPDGMFPTDESVPLSVPDVTNPRYSYGGGKIACELAMMAYAQEGILGRSVVVRPHNIYGPDMGHEHVIPEFIERMSMLPSGTGTVQFKIQGTGLETRSFCQIDDAVEGLLIAGSQGENRSVYHLGNPAEEHTIASLAMRIATRMDRQIEIVPGKLPQGSPPRRLPSISKLRKLGFAPTISLDDGLAATIPWYEDWVSREQAA